MAEKQTFLQLEKYDSFKGLATGLVTAQQPDCDGEIINYEASKPYFEKWSEYVLQNSRGLSYGNVRLNHDPEKPVGRVVSPLQFDDAEKTIRATVEVVDDNARKLLETGCLTGFSIGGNYVSKTPLPNGLISYCANPHEISVVDMPCLPSATFSVVKAGGSLEKRRFKTVMNQEQILGYVVKTVVAKLMKDQKPDGSPPMTDYEERIDSAVNAALAAANNADLSATYPENEPKRENPAVVQPAGQAAIADEKAKAGEPGTSATTFTAGSESANTGDVAPEVFETAKRAAVKAFIESLGKGDETAKAAKALNPDEKLTQNPAPGPFLTPGEGKIPESSENPVCGVDIDSILADLKPQLLAAFQSQLAAQAGAEKVATPELTKDTPTQRVAGEDLPASAFLIVPDKDKSSTWKLPVHFSTEEKTKSHIRNAIARFNQLKGVSQADKDAAWSKLKSLAEKYGIDMEADKPSKAIQAHQEAIAKAIEEFEAAESSYEDLINKVAALKASVSEDNMSDLEKARKSVAGHVADIEKALSAHKAAHDKLHAAHDNLLEAHKAVNEAHKAAHESRVMHKAAHEAFSSKTNEALDGIKKVLGGGPEVAFTGSEVGVSSDNGMSPDFGTNAPANAANAAIAPKALSSEDLTKAVSAAVAEALKAFAPAPEPVAEVKPEPVAEVKPEPVSDVKKAVVDTLNELFKSISETKEAPVATGNRAQAVPFTKAEDNGTAAKAADSMTAEDWKAYRNGDSKAVQKAQALTATKWKAAPQRILNRRGL